MASALFTSSFSIGNFVGPMLGGFLFEHTNFGDAAGYFGFAVLVINIFYFFFSGIIMK